MPVEGKILMVTPRLINDCIINKLEIPVKANLLKEFFDKLDKEKILLIN